ncbi:fungal-specific transcription factor domain-containing protein [Calycina marina]|uniref:Fungal-specific transcription factor domain-containing protein n=1 Tax=Calycina marina TaxID=1763456 RepID=A0A9P7Z946_9HELO|nr:fungal-specific transcription factor domain-containing protein [Calycina marina]
MHDDHFDLSPLLSLEVESPEALPESNTAPGSTQPVVARPINKRRGKKRSSRACTTCRARKVRCNIVAHGAPCSNCRHDETDCVLPLSRRQRSARERAEQQKQQNQSLPITMSIMGSENGDHYQGLMDYDQCSSHGSVSFTQEQPWERAHSPELLGPHGMNILDHPLAEIISPTTLAPAVHISIPPTSSRTKSWIQIQSPLSSVHKESLCSAYLPRVFVPFPRHLIPTDINFLRSRDALSLPPENLQVELLKAYVEYVHPSMPVLDLEGFLSSVKYGYESYDGQRGQGIERENAQKRQISLLLFQAVMFAGVSYVPLRSLKDAGFQTRDAAKRAFFSRVRLCYDFDTCTDRQAIIQALLLMTLSPVSASPENKDAYHWLGLAISLSYSLGLNRASTNQKFTIRKKRLERRIWWTAFIRDRTLALNTSGVAIRPVRIRTDDCDVEMLCLADFDLSSAANDIEEEGGDEMKFRQNVLAYIQKARICWCSNDVSIIKFGTFSPRVQPNRLPQAFVIPEPEPDLMHEEQIYTANSYTSSTPLFESVEENTHGLAHSSPATSLHDEPTTPQVYPELVPAVAIFRKSILCEDDSLDAGFGVDGEYDDYLEFLKPPGGASKQEFDNRPRESWAFQFDCENDRVMEI